MKTIKKVSCECEQRMSLMWSNEVILNDLHGEIYRKQAADKFPDSCKCTLAAIQAVQNKNSTNKGS